MDPHGVERFINKEWFDTWRISALSVKLWKIVKFEWFLIIIPVRSDVNSLCSTFQYGLLIKSRAKCIESDSVARVQDHQAPGVSCYGGVCGIVLGFICNVWFSNRVNSETGDQFRTQSLSIAFMLLSKARYWRRAATVMIPRGGIETHHIVCFLFSWTAVYIDPLWWTAHIHTHMCNVYVHTRVQLHSVDIVSLWAFFIWNIHAMSQAQWRLLFYIMTDMCTWGRWRFVARDLNCT